MHTMGRGRNGHRHSGGALKGGKGGMPNAMVWCRTEGSATARKPNNTTVHQQREGCVYNLRINGEGVAHADTLRAILAVLDGYKNLGFVSWDTAVNVTCKGREVDFRIK